MEAFASRIGSRVIGVVPRSPLVQESELEAKTVVEKFPDSDQAAIYRELADEIYGNTDFTVPEPMDQDEFEEFFRRFIYSKDN